jgi:hypothetical protein
VDRRVGNSAAIGYVVFFTLLTYVVALVDLEGDGGPLGGPLGTVLFLSIFFAVGLLVGRWWVLPLLLLPVLLVYPSGSIRRTAMAGPTPACS